MNDKINEELIEKTGIYFENGDFENTLLYQKKYEINHDDIYTLENLAASYIMLTRYQK